MIQRKSHRQSGAHHTDFDKHSRKASDNASSIFFQEESFISRNQSYEFLYQEPELPPKVIGSVRKCYKIFSCLSSNLVMVLNFESIRMFKGSVETIGEPVLIIRVKDIKSLFSYRKKDSFFIRLAIKQQGNIDLRFQNRDICKQWIMYINQSMEFNEYLTQKQHYYKKQSFNKFIHSLSIQNSQRVIKLDDSTVITRNNAEQNNHENTTIIKDKISVVRLSDFKATHRIGKGAFSTVYRAQKDGQVYALKQMNKDELLYKNQMKYALTELNVLRSCRACPYIIPLSYAFQTEDYLYLAIKYFPYGNLQQILDERKVLTYQEAFNILCQLIVAIEYLHEHKILYRDLKPENILLDKIGHVVLIDFGLSIQLNQDQEFAESFVGTPLYFIPQRLEGVGKINYKGDIYNVGCIFYAMLHGKAPFQGESLEAIINNIKYTELEINSDLNVYAKAFLRETLQKNPEKRLAHMGSHPLFEGVDWQKIKKKQTAPIMKLKQKKTIDFIGIKSINDADYTEKNYPKKKVNEWNFTIKK